MGRKTILPNLSNLTDSTCLYLHDGLRESRSLLAIGQKEHQSFRNPTREDIVKLKDFIKKQKGWKFGWISYDVKNALEDLETPLPDPIGFPDLHFFVPRIVISVEKGELTVLSGNDQPDCHEVVNALKKDLPNHQTSTGTLSPRITKEEYLQAIRTLQEHIQRGDIYEINFCQDFYSENHPIEPFGTYLSLHHLTKAPFSVFLKHEDSYLLCGSPERYIKKAGTKLISEPIKGTIRRGKDEAEDALLKEALRTDVKERGENIMITDLVRNDLSKIAQKGSVKVEELCGIHSFETVHQMISTVTAQVDEETDFADTLLATFPMGSMTGAPKVRAMQLTDRYEVERRGLYSGSVGYIDPNGDFDFNVVIRSLLYNAQSHYLSAKVGGAITALSEPEKEYEECLLKAEALFRSLH
ncbi:MAG: anthranilate synthase component I family protein [Flavobacteriales bacterium]|nr:anthranilate synthase component I family protein [Flavobacteriales bacterium]MDG1781791.1 anthranilate synthase component I family protein [Flavobacteriales bacterium]MDG2246031.1 anthranilate synthase component I family protein [Flavobacteriales bacterium]